MKTLPVALAILLGAALSPCHALRDIGVISRERAKEIGLEVRAQGNGPQVWIELEFKPEGDFQHFSHVELDISEGEKLLLGYAPLKDARTAAGRVVVRFLADRAFVDKITLTVVVGDFESTGYEVRVKDFVEAAKVR